MAIAVGQHAATTGGTTSAVATQASGSSFLLFIADVSGQTHAVSDSKGNVYTLRGSEIDSSTSIGLKCYYKENGTGGSGHTFSVTGGVAPSLFAIEITGGLTASGINLDFAGRGDAATPFTANNTTATSQADELWVSAISSDSGNAASSFGISGNGFSAVLDSVTDGTSFVCGAVSTLVVSATGTPDPAWTESHTTGAAVGLITIKAIAGSSGILRRRSMSGGFENLQGGMIG